MLKGIGYIDDGGKMYLEPKNRHVLVYPVDDKEKEEQIIILPDDYEPQKSAYVPCDVLGMADDCSIGIDVGDRIIVERRMIQEIKAAGETNYLVLENYVYGRLQDQ